MVLAQAEELDVLDDHHFVADFVEQSAVDDLLEVRFVAAGQELQRSLKSFGGPRQSLPRSVLAQLSQDVAHMMRNAACLLVPLGRHYFHNCLILFHCSSIEFRFVSSIL